LLFVVAATFRESLPRSAVKFDIARYLDWLGFYGQSIE
jgi:hypothetical protein